jgi:hypothetical protein
MMSKVKQMMGMVQNAQNPTAMMNQMITNNPQFKQIMDVVKENGGDPKAAFYSMADKMGVDPQDILNMFN